MRGSFQYLSENSKQENLHGERWKNPLKKLTSPLPRWELDLSIRLWADQSLTYGLFRTPSMASREDLITD